MTYVIKTTMRIEVMTDAGSLLDAAEQAPFVLRALHDALEASPRLLQVEQERVTIEPMEAH